MFIVRSCVYAFKWSYTQVSNVNRDIKPSNFLFSIEANTGVLVDFGLAQKDTTKKFANDAKSLTKASTFKAPSPGSNSNPKLILSEKIFNANQKLWYLQNDTRPVLRAERAGTRGFRAPEVLFRVAQQTTAIDIWSVGSIFLSLATHRYPFFQSNTDTEALVEIACVFGKSRIQNLATKLGIIN